MIRSTKKSMLVGAALAVAGLLSFPFHANAAPLNSNASTVQLTATLNEALSVSTTVSAVTFNLANGQTVNGSAAVPIKTEWVLGPSRTSVKLYGFFADATAALTDGYTAAPDNIPSSAVLGQVTTGAATTATPFSQTAPFGGASAGLLLVNQPISAGSANFVANRTDNLNLSIVTPASLPAGTYTGTLTIQAQAN